MDQKVFWVSACWTVTFTFLSGCVSISHWTSLTWRKISSGSFTSKITGWFSIRANWRSSIISSSTLLERGRVTRFHSTPITISWWRSTPVIRSISLWDIRSISFRSSIKIWFIGFDFLFQFISWIRNSTFPSCFSVVRDSTLCQRTYQQQ
eukprot:UN34208